MKRRPNTGVFFFDWRSIKKGDMIEFQSNNSYEKITYAVKADIRNPLRYLLMNRCRFQRHLSRDFVPC